MNHEKTRNRSRAALADLGMTVTNERSFEERRSKFETKLGLLKTYVFSTL